MNIPIMFLNGDDEMLASICETAHCLLYITVHNLGVPIVPKTYKQMV